MYTIIRTFLFLFDPEQVHYVSMNLLQLLCRISFVKTIIRKRYNPAGQPHRQWQLLFKNRVGLGAGFDKNARYLTELEALGFGFVEIGTVTPKPQEGNEKPRLFRLPKDKALINRMGFNNDGVQAVATRLQAWRKNQVLQDGQLPLIIGGNIGKNKSTPNHEAWKDYATCFEALHPYVDYFVVNVSSPNTPGLRELQDKDALRKILTHLQQLNQLLAKRTDTPSTVVKPILLKIAPDLSWPQIDDVISLAMEIQLDGLVACNTTIARDNLKTATKLVESIGQGGLSGKPVQQMSTAIVRYITDQTNGRIPVVASGGIFTAADAREKLNAGAGLIQVWTGFVYQGPGIVREVCKNL